MPALAFANRVLATEGGYDDETAPGIGHILQIQAPEVCRKLLVDFLRGCGVRG